MKRMLASNNESFFRACSWGKVVFLKMLSTTMVIDRVMQKKGVVHRDR